MAADAHAMLRSRAFGSSGSSSENDEDEGDFYHNKPNSNGLVGKPDNELGVGQETAANLASFEESFVPEEPPLAPLGNKPRPKTPSLKAQHAPRNKILRDAAGFVRQDGPRSMYGRENAVVQDLSQAPEDSRNGEDGDDDRDGDEGDGLKDQPSFERSDSHSMRILEERKRNNANGNVKKGFGSASSASLAKQSNASSKQNLTLREQEKVHFYCPMSRTRHPLTLMRHNDI